MQSILPEDPVFEESLMNPVLLAMATYLCGYGVVLSAMGCWMKGPNETTFTMHTDSGGTPEPMPAHAYTCQCAYVLTDYNRENGSTCFVPGSHKWGRKPKGREAILLPYEKGARSKPSRPWPRRARCSSGTGTPGTARSIAPRPGCASR